MFNWFPYRIRLAKAPSPALPRIGPRSRAALGLLASAGLLVGWAVPVGADSTAVVTITTGVRSVAVSPGGVAFTFCESNPGVLPMVNTGTTLTFPTGFCSATAVTVTNGALASHIFVASSSTAIPSDAGGHPWQICKELEFNGPGDGAPICTGPLVQNFNRPGADEFTSYLSGSGFGHELGPTPVCDPSFGPSGCAANPGESHSSTPSLFGPTSSTDGAGSLTYSIFWTAAP